jgi:hypothetical protein
MKLWHTDCVLQVSRRFGLGLLVRRAAAVIRERNIEPAIAPRDGRSNFLGARSFTD